MHDGLAARPGRKLEGARQPNRSAGKRVRALALRCTGLAVRHWSVLVGSAAGMAVAAAIGLNALSWQNSAHPAPIFARGERAELPGAKRVEAAALQLPPARPAASAVPASPPVPPVRASLSRELPAEPARSSETGSIAKLEPQKPIANAQRALTKLGFGPLKADGVMGPGTRQAIERYERSRGLPVTGELAARTMRDLLAQAGSSAD